MTDPPMDQAEHARIFAEVTRRLLCAAVDFARAVAPVLSPDDVARIYAGIGAYLAGGPACEAGPALLREIADRLEAAPETCN